MFPLEEGDDSKADSDSSFEVTSTELNLFPDAPVVRVDEQDAGGRICKQRFYSGMLTLGLQPKVEAVYKQVFSTKSFQAKVKTFAFMSKVMENIQAGYGKEQFVWFGGSKEEINIILKYGFPSNGPAICLSPLDSPLGSLRSCVEDEFGLYHFILCRVLLGRSEAVSPATRQRCPSSEEFHSGVDNLSSPGVYMVWSTHMNTNILPQYVISFIPVKGKVSAVNVSTAPKISRDTINFFMLLHELTMGLSLNTIRALLKLRSDQQEGRMNVLEFRLRVEELVGIQFLNRTQTLLQRQIVAGNSPYNRSASDKETWNIENVVLPQIDASRGVFPHDQSRMSCSSSNRFSKTNILQQNVVSFRSLVPAKEKEETESVSSSPGVRRAITFPMLLHELTMVLPMNTIRTLLMLLSDHEEGKMGDLELRRKLEEIVGQDMLNRASQSL